MQQLEAMGVEEVVDLEAELEVLAEGLLGRAAAFRGMPAHPRAGLLQLLLQRRRRRRRPRPMEPQVFDRLEHERSKR